MGAMPKGERFAGARSGIFREQPARENVTMRSVEELIEKIASATAQQTKTSNGTKQALSSL